MASEAEMKQCVYVFAFPEELLKLPMLLFLRSLHTFRQQSRKCSFTILISLAIILFFLYRSGCKKVVIGTIVLTTDTLMALNINISEKFSLKKKKRMHNILVILVFILDTNWFIFDF